MAVFKKIDGKQYKFVGSAAKGPAADRQKKAFKVKYKNVRIVPATNADGTKSKKYVDIYAYGKL